MEWISLLWEYVKNNRFISFFVLFIIGIMQNIIANISTPDSSIVINFFNKIFSFFQSNISIRLWIIILLILILQVIIFSILLIFPNIRNGFIKEFQDIKTDDRKEKNIHASDKKVILTILFIILLPIGLYLLFKSKNQTEKTNKLSDKEMFLIWYFYIYNKKIFSVILLILSMILSGYGIGRKKTIN